MLTILGSLGISYTHGSNDGQKGVGLLMIVLIAFMPAYYALSPQFNNADAEKMLAGIESQIITNTKNEDFNHLNEHLKEELDKTKVLLLKMSAESGKAEKETILKVRKQFRNVLPKEIKKVTTHLESESLMGSDKKKSLNSYSKKLLTFTDFAPTWTIILISLCLGIGTMIGWKRVVVTIGEKIGKSGLDYSQGLISQVVSAGTIFASTYLKLPVSTTHIVSSSIMGTMFAKGGKNNIQRKTIVNILMAWILTLPVSIGLSALLFLLFRMFI
jgi:PiT family inorganic phosphate transporter